ncbi:MAG: hypothetical protein JST85_05580 [Acidobacteria bacterium]|nr:hypothetical protein [Acidobacteriota bacterium]
MAQVIIDINPGASPGKAVFSPSSIDVSNGDQISWRNNDQRPTVQPLNPDPDPQAHWPAPVGGADDAWFANRIPGKPPGFDPPMSQGVVTFNIPGPPKGQTTPTSQTFQYRDATGNTSALGTIVVWNPAPPANPDSTLAD